ncbi:acetyl-CoA C-acetyltransferase [Roseovarius nanhaiticus]|uniref:Acetyl-CoA C-acetyltransferase n=1 Tax=Roseovarius nanhaiticus TaxID=573024 RepID=A0A1N7ELR3_9RHOB|nr:acetyl-CoA C-acetyltransferase [Roseovarius nanhaiticus]SEK72231.1 acetyl-CoA C-acetyltransferase [Roseovarius nanhaiticus]SIR88845.1 acetyl-CoA C-acetyltransferase [Roseovarius nanhaiticus]
MTEPQRVFLVDGARTPFLKARGTPGPFTPVDLAVQCGRPLLARQPFAREALDLVILGCVNVMADEMNPARVAALRLGLGERMVAFTMQINCGSGMQSIDTAYRYIRSGSHDMILAGGAEALSHTPLILRQSAAEWLGRLGAARSPMDKLKLLGDVRPDFFKPVIGLERGLTDPITELGMGQTAEILAHRFGITREMADEYAMQSHHRLAAAQKGDALKGEVVPAFGPDGTVYDHDDGVRPDSDMAGLAKPKPVFEKPYGKVTAGNSSQITDGASWLIVASEKAINLHGLEPIAEITDSEWAGLDPAVMGLGPVLSSTPIVQRHGLSIEDVDLWELNEAFAAQVLACVAAWDHHDFCREVLGFDAAFGRIDRERLNVDGGAISLGHPVGTSGNRIVLHLANAMNKRGAKRGIATECIGGGLGGAMMLEAVQ